MRPGSASANGGSPEVPSLAPAGEEILQSYLIRQRAHGGKVYLTSITQNECHFRGSPGPSTEEELAQLLAGLTFLCPDPFSGSRG